MHTGFKIKIAWSAIAQAAYDTGVALYPRQRAPLKAALDKFFQQWPASNVGMKWGAAVAAKYLSDRSGDGAGNPSNAFKPFTGVPKVYENAPDPFAPNNPTMYAPGWGAVKPFFLEDIHKQTTRLPNPATLSSMTYARDFKQVKEVGQATSTVRTQDQLYIGAFWAYDGAFGIGTPPRLYQQVVDAIVAKLRRSNPGKVDSGLKLLRLYALTSGVMADACIAAWYEKYSWMHWRPINGIRWPTGLPGMKADPDWKPFGVPLTNVEPNPQTAVEGPISATYRTPMFPAYPSGHATMGTAILKAAAKALDIPETFKFSMTSEELDGKTKDQSGQTRPNVPRTFSIAGAIEENKASRVYLGVHWEFDCAYGASLGTEVAEQGAAAFLNTV
jgi:hypothetical protein